MSHNSSEEYISTGLQSGGSSSSRSRHAVINGTKSFAWNNEMVRSDQPYVNGLFHRAHNPPPNELGFVGGIGRKVGRHRSKVHPQRPTQLQQIFGMRNQNMILHSFTQPIPDVFSPQKHPKGSRNTITAIVKDVTSADMIASSISQLDSGSTASTVHAAKTTAPDTLAVSAVSDTVDGQPFYYSPKAINERVRNYLENTSKDDIYAGTTMSVTDEQNFRRWAMQIRSSTNYQPSSNTHSDAYYDLEDRKTVRSRAAPLDSYRTEGATSMQSDDTKVKLNKRCNPVNIIRKITGYMYGPFTRPATPDPLTQSENKFGIPKSMTDRVVRFEQRDAVQSEVLRRQRTEKMGMHQPPMSDDSDDENESTLNVKHLALVRTPYFVVPTIRMDRVKRMERYCNKYLRGDRLKRINLLLRDDNRPKKETKEMLEERKDRQKQHVLAKFSTLRNRKKKMSKDISGRDPEKADYYKIIDTSYEKNRKKCEPKEESEKPISFGQFKNIPDPVDLQNLAIQLDPLEHRSDTADTDRARSLRSRFAKSQPRKLFERNRNERLSRHYDNIDGPFYIDPNLMDKFRSPKKFKSPQKYYTNLIKGKHWIRDRLQVNGPRFEEEKIGVKDNKYYHRLATEWDEYYFHELRHRPRVRKFCVKTDVMALRDICRRNFVMYHIQENLMDMEAKQRKESEYMDNVESFQKICVREFVTWKSDAYDKVVESNARLDQLRKSIDQMQTEKSEMMSVMDGVNLRIFQLEERWNYLMKLQNYYYLLQSTEWREQFDWIHREVDGSLSTPMFTIKLCSQRNIRSSGESSGLLIKQFFDLNIEPHMEQMRRVQPEVQQLEDSLQMLNANCMKGLMQHNQTFWMYNGVLGMSRKLLDQIDKGSEARRDLILIVKRDSHLMMERGNQTKQDALALVEKSLPSAVRNPVERKVLAIATEMHHDLRKTAQLDARETALNAQQCFQQVHQHAMSLLDQLDAIPLDVLRVAEKFQRANRRIVQERTADALNKQKRYDLMRRQIENHFSEVAQFRRVQIKLKQKSKITVSQ